MSTNKYEKIYLSEAGRLPLFSSIHGFSGLLTRKGIRNGKTIHAEIPALSEQYYTPLRH